jgi:hypothetical protein
MSSLLEHQLIVEHRIDLVQSLGRKQFAVAITCHMMDRVHIWRYALMD